MTLRSFSRALAAIALGSATLGAQADTAATQCSAGPGALFGVTGYQCANCSFTRDINGTARYTFNAEPTVLSTTDGTLVQAGDVIVAVNSQPIVSRLGADQFTYPASGRAVLTVRRGDQRVDLLFTLASGCRGPLLRGEGFSYRPGGGVSADTARASVGVGSGRGGRMGGGVGAGGRGGGGSIAVARSGGGGRGGRMSSSDTTRERAAAMLDSTARRLRDAQMRERSTLDSIMRRQRPDTLVNEAARAIMLEQQRRNAQDADERQRQLENQILAMRQMIDQLARQVESSRVASTSGSEPDMGRFGLALGCSPSCTRTRAPDGTFYWRYDDYPPIVALRTNGPASMAGIRVGDVVTRVDGISILTAEGAQRFFRAGAGSRLTLTIRRAGEDRQVNLEVGPPRD